MIKSCGLRSIKVDRGGYFPRKTSSWLEETDSIKYSFSATKSCSRSFDVLLDIKAAMLEGALAVTSLQGETSAGRAGGEKAEGWDKAGGARPPCSRYSRGGAPSLPPWSFWNQAQNIQVSIYLFSPLPFTCRPFKPREVASPVPHLQGHALGPNAG